MRQPRGGRSRSNRSGTARLPRARPAFAFVSSSSSSSCSSSRRNGCSRPCCDMLAMRRTERACLVVLRDRLERLDVLEPEAVHTGATRRRGCGYGGEQALERFGELFELRSRSSSGTCTPARPTFASKPVSALERVAHAAGERRVDRCRRRAPRPRARPACGALGGANRQALARRCASRACGGRRRREPRAPRVRGPRSARSRPIIASTSSGSSSRRTRFETVGFELPTRSATSPSDSPNSSISNA